MGNDGQWVKQHVFTNPRNETWKKHHHKYRHAIQQGRRKLKYVEDYKWLAHAHTRVMVSRFLKWTSKQIGHKSKKQQVIKHPLLSICFVSKCHVFVKTPNVSPRNQQTITNDVFPHKKNGSLPFLELTARTWKWMIGRLPPFWYVNSCFWFPW